MSSEELLWLAEQASKHKLIVEIGCYKGRSTRALADNTTGQVIAIDDFWGPREIDILDRASVYAEYCYNTASCRNLTTFVQDHKYAYCGYRPDMVFIDGSHTYEHVLGDIQLWLSYLLPEGLICGHDYGSDWPGVDRAVREMFGEPERGPGSIWYRRCG